MIFQELLTALKTYQLIGQPDDLEICGLQYDSRQVRDGDLFFCISGFKTDGHLFAAEALKAGAAALVVERDLVLPQNILQVKVPSSRIAMAELAAKFYAYPSAKLGLVGVTGTNGKTTTTYLIKSVLESSFQVGLIGTIGNLIGGQSLPSERTTPESLDLQKLYARMVQAGVDYGVMEVSSHALQLGRVHASFFDVGVYTNLTQDHLDFHQNLSSYRDAKGLLFEMLGKQPKQRKQYAVVNRDDPNSDFFYSKANVPVVSYGTSDDCDFQAKAIELRGDGLTYTICFPKGEVVLQLKLMGLFNVYNSLAAFVVGYQEGIPVNRIKTSLEKVQGIAGRFERIDEGQDFMLIVDYAHTPDGLKNVLSFAKGLAKGRLITVFGCGGDRDKTKRPRMAEVVSSYSDYVFVTSDNPRSENPQSIIDDILPGLSDASRYQVIEDRREAIKHAISIAQPQDLVLIAGKGHETGQEIMGKLYPFDDRKVARELLKKLV